jgi:hypothetical protein
VFFLLLALLIGTLAWLWWHRRTTTLTRNCRWRQDKAAGVWRCRFCGGEVEGEKAPVRCVRSEG